MPVTTSNKLTTPISTSIEIRAKTLVTIERPFVHPPTLFAHLYYHGTAKRNGRVIQVSPDRHKRPLAAEGRRAAAALFNSIDQNYALAPDSPLFPAPVQ